MESVLVLDGNQRSALAVTRSLGAKGIRVVVGDETRRSLAGSSRFAAESFQYPSPRANPEGFLDTLVRECERRCIDVLYPMTDISMYHVLAERDRLRVTIPYGSFEAYEQLSDKWKFFKMAAELGVSTPVTHFVSGAGDLRRVADDLRFPLVIKPYRSQMFASGRWVHAGVRYADTFEELEATVINLECFAGHRFLLQEYIRGENQGLFAISNRGVPQSYFANRRLRDVPPEGGIVVLVESLPMNEKTRAIAERILTHVGWHGVSMLECKIRDGVPYVLEMNARFWASTQLAVDCGVDYPWLLYQLATGRPLDTVRRYQEHRRMRDLLGDIEHYYMTVAGLGLNRYDTHEERRRALAGFWKPLDAHTYYEKNRWNDLRPFLFDIGRALRKVHPVQMLRHVIAGLRGRGRRIAQRVTDTVRPSSWRRAA